MDTIENLRVFLENGSPNQRQGEQFKHWLRALDALTRRAEEAEKRADDGFWGRAAARLVKERDDLRKLVGETGDALKELLSLTRRSYSIGLHTNIEPRRSDVMNLCHRMPELISRAEAATKKEG